MTQQPASRLTRASSQPRIFGILLLQTAINKVGDSVSSQSLEQVAAQALRQERATFLLSSLALNEQSLLAPAFRYGPIRAFSLQDDRGSSDDCLCTIFQMADQWYIGFQGHRTVFTQLIGPTSAVHTAHVWEQLRVLWARVIATEGSLRRQE